MKTLLVYGTKHGATKQIALELQKLLGSCEIVDVDAFTGDFANYDKIIFGTNVYAGQFHKKIKEQVKQCINQNRKVAVYISGINEQEIDKQVQENFGEELRNSIEHVAILGGMLDFKKMNFFERQIIKLINKKGNLYDRIPEDGIVNKINYKGIEEFVGVIKDEKERYICHR